MTQIEQTEVIDGVTYALHIEPEDIDVRGNAMASGDSEVDRKAEDWILGQLLQGNQWAWCTVVVTAALSFQGQRFEAEDTLGCCSYANVHEFCQEGGYYQDMRHQALAALKGELELAKARGRTAREALRNLNMLTRARKKI